MDVDDAGGGQLFPDGPATLRNSAEETKECLDVLRLHFALESENCNAARVERLGEFLSAGRIHFLLPVHQAVAGDTEDNVARRRAQIGQPPVDQVERPGQGRVAGRVGGQILPSERQHAHEFRNLLAGSGGWHTAILAARTFLAAR